MSFFHTGAIRPHGAQGASRLCQHHGGPEPVVREVSRKVKSYVALRQKRAEMRRGPFWGEVRETKARDETPKPGAHRSAHALRAARDRLVDGINSSAAYGDTFAKSGPAHGKLKSYCLKGVTSEAAYRTGIRRMKGSHPLPEGGDRVRVSPAVRDALIRAERIEPYTRTYAKNPARARRGNPTPAAKGSCLLAA